MTGNTLKSSLKQTMKHFTSVVEIVIILVVARVCVCAHLSSQSQFQDVDFICCTYIIPFNEFTT